MRTLRFHGYGEPADVLRLEETEALHPRTGHVRVRVHACGLNPADLRLPRFDGSCSLCVDGGRLTRVGDSAG